MRSAQLALAAISFAGLALPQASEYDSIYRGEAGDVFSRQPNAFLAEMVRSRKPGSALDVGMGQGRNSIYLAQRGWQVTGIDTSGEGIRQAKLEATRLGLTIRAEVADFEEFDFGENRWDLIVLVYEPTKAVAPKVVRALKAGGAVVVEDRHVDTRRVCRRAPLPTTNCYRSSLGSEPCITKMYGLSPTGARRRSMND